MFFEIFFEHFSDLQSSEIRHEYETNVKRWYEREETERNASLKEIPEWVLLGDMSPFGDIKEKSRPPGKTFFEKTFNKPSGNAISGS